MSVVNRSRMVLVLTVGLALVGCAKKDPILEGERFDPRAPLADSVPVDGKPVQPDTTGQIENRSAPISLPPITANADWTHRAGNASHRPPHAALSASPAVVWSVKLGEGNSRQNRISAAPVVAGGRVFAMDALSDVTAVSTAGAVLWKTDLTPDFDRSSLSGGGLAFADGRLYATTGFGEVLAIDPATGSILWRQRLDASITGAPAADGGLVYVVGRDGAAWAVKGDTGRVVWQLTGTPSVSGVAGSAGPAVEAKLVLLPFSTGQVIAAQKATGVGLWSLAVVGERLGRSYATVTDITGDPVIAGGIAYVANQSGRTVAVDVASGERQWTATQGAVGPVMVAGNGVFMVTDENKLARLDSATGDVVWAVQMPYYPDVKENRRKSITAHYGPVLAGGRLVVASGDGVLRFFSPVDGSSLGSVPLPGGAAGMPALAGGMMFIPNQKGELLAFR